MRLDAIQQRPRPSIESSRSRRPSPRRPRNEAGGRRAFSRHRTDKQTQRAAAAERVAASAALSALGDALPLPRVGEEVPPVLRGDSGCDAETVEMARSMLQCGVLRESDWNEKAGLQGSIERGLQRHFAPVSEFLADENACQIPLYFLCSPDAPTSDYMDKYSFSETAPNPLPPDMGFFGLGNMAQHVPSLGIKEPFEALSTQVGARAAQGVFHALQNGLMATCEAFTPREALFGVERRAEYLRDFGIIEEAAGVEREEEIQAIREQAWKNNDFRRLDKEIERYTGLLTPTTFSRKIPKFLLNADKPSELSLQRAAHRTTGTVSTVLEHALSTHRATEDLLEMVSAQDDGLWVPRLYHLSEHPFILFREEGDNIWRAYDDERQEHYDSADCVCDLNFAVAFRRNDVESVRRAADRMTATLRVLGLCHELIVYLKAIAP